MYYVKATINEKVIIWTKNHSYSSIEGLWNSKKRQREVMSEEEFLNLAKENNWFWKHSPIKFKELVDSNFPGYVSNIVEVEVV